MMGTKPDDKTLEELFNELDKDGSNDVDCDELGVFVMKFF
jgi:Ca2+-binding EF-hand superfamily protein